MTTEVIVTERQNTVIIDTKQPQTIVAGMIGPQTMAALTDVDLSGLINGGLLVYNSNAAKWKVTNKLEGQIIESGQF